MLEVKNVTKMFNKDKGIKNITFKAEKGKILGILRKEWCR